MSETRVAVVQKISGFGGVYEAALRAAKAFEIAGADTTIIFLRAEGAPTAVPRVRTRILAQGDAARRSRALGLPLLRTVFAGGFSEESSPDLLSWSTSPECSPSLT